MSRLPRLTGSEVIAVLAKAGFTVVRIKGSHHRLHHPETSHGIGYWMPACSGHDGRA